MGWVERRKEGRKEGKRLFFFEGEKKKVKRVFVFLSVLSFTRASAPSMLFLLTAEKA